MSKETLIILSAGHSNVPGRDRGASANGYVEGDLTVELRQLVYVELMKLGIEPIVDGNNSIFTESINYFRKKVNSKSLNVEFHWNSGPSLATGVETIVPVNPSATETRIAELLSGAISILLGIPKRGNNGVKTEADTHHGKLAWMRLVGENILVEVCFISNPKDMDSYMANKFQLAKKIAQILHNEVKEFKVFTQNYPVVKYTVKTNDTLSSISRMYNTSVEAIKKENNLTSDLIHTSQTLLITNKN